MAPKIKKKLQNIFSHRIALLMLIFGCFGAILVVRIFQLQIISGAEYAESFTMTTTKTRTINSARGNIYDSNGNLLAYNELSNNVTLEDSGDYSTTREKNLMLNGEIYRLIKLIEGCGDSMDDNFHIDLDSNGNYIFDLAAGSRSLDRFRADIFGKSYIEDLTDEQLKATPDEIMDYLCSSERFALVNDDKPYTQEELSKAGLPEELTKDEALKIVRIRYSLSLTSYQRYMRVTIASDVNDSTVAAIMENSASLEGVSIEEDSKRVYNYAESMSSIIGYTGVISSDELEELETQRSDYNLTSVVGKTGIEQYMETTLQGVDGSEKVAVDNLGTVLKVYEDSVVEPKQGDDVYLTIDAELQEACYNILEQRIVGILVSNIRNVKTTDEIDITPGDDTIYIPIYDVYNALINNSVIDIKHFEETDATALEESVLDRYNSRFEVSSENIKNELSGGSQTTFSKLSEEMQAYISYIVNDLLTDNMGIITLWSGYEDDETYKEWEAGSISTFSYLYYLVSNNRIDLSKLYDNSVYTDTSDVMNVICTYVMDYILDDTDFAKLQYKYMILDDTITPEEIVRLLYDQNVLSKEDDLYLSFMSGKTSPSDLIMNKISNLEITPAQLALDPCSGSIVITDPTTGSVKALVSYPGYDNNRLANTMDTEYYNQLYEDKSTPFYNKATQQLTAPGSTYKPVIAAAALSEGIIDTSTIINCNGLFGEGLVDKSDQLHCWLLTGHGDENIVDAIKNSCNVFFATLGFRLGLDDTGTYSSALALSKIYDYSSRFNLDQKTNIQLTESAPQVSDDMPIPSSIGQGTHLYTTTQLARYAGTIYNDGISYDLNLLSKVTDSSGNVLKEYSSNAAKNADIDSDIFATIKEGMHQGVQNNAVFKDFAIDCYGKTGTAEEDETRPPHALFIGCSSYETASDISFAVRIAYGYSSSNAAVVAKDVLSYYYGLEDESEIITGASETEGLSNEVTD